MIKTLKWLGGSAVAVALGLLLFGASGVFTATGVRADSPPNPPARFVGSVKVDGQAPAPGTAIEVRIGSATCGTTSTFNQGGESRYAVDSPALDPGASPNCGTVGAVATFYIGGRMAAETGSWRNYDINIVNLTYTTPTPTPSATPRPPATGSGFVAGGDSTATWPFAAFGLAALAFGVGGATVARRRR